MRRIPPFPCFCFAVFLFCIPVGQELNAQREAHAVQGPTPASSAPARSTRPPQMAIAALANPAPENFSAHRAKLAIAAHTMRPAASSEALPVVVARPDSTALQLGMAGRSAGQGGVQ